MNIRIRLDYNFFIVFFIFTFVFIHNVQSVNWISIDGSNKGVYYSTEVVESSLSCYKIKVKIHGIDVGIIEKEGSLYHTLTLGDDILSDQLGKPSLPIISQQLYIPDGKSFDVTIQEGKWHNIPIGTIYPIQRPVIDTQDETDFIKDYETYNSNIYSPQIVKYNEVMDFVGIQYVTFDICPFKYYPLDNTLSVLSEFIFQVRYNSLNISSKIEGTPSINKTQYDILSRSFDNSNIITVSNKVGRNNANETYDYLIITGDIPGVQECRAIKNFITWKSFKGFKSNLVSTTSIGVSCDSIKNYIAQEYQRMENGLKYVLFVGDEDKIPVKLLPNYKLGVHDTTYSDSWYTCMGGIDDHQMDIPIGRFATNDTIEIMNIVNKTIKYEGCYYPSYDGNALLIANAEGAPNQFQGCLETIKNTTYLHPYAFETLYGASSQNGGDNATNQDVINCINQRFNLINYRGHGISNCWPWWNYLGEWFNSPQIDNMNDDVCSVFLSIACQNSNIKDSLTCMMEVFTRPQHGAVAFLGATLDTERSNNNVFNKRLYKELLNNSIVHIGQMIMESCKSITNSYYGRTNAYRYLLGGDPSLEIWTSTPHPFTDVVFTSSSDSLSISVPNQNDIMLSVVAENGEHLFNDTLNINGVCKIEKPLVGCFIVLNKHDFIPYILYYNTANNKYIHYDLSSQYIQNVEFNHDAVYYNTPIAIGNNVNTNEAYGNVIVKSGHSLTFPMKQEVLIKNGFEVENNATLEIK